MMTQEIDKQFDGRVEMVRTVKELEEEVSKIL
jgi:hypothetical protein